MLSHLLLTHHTSAYSSEQDARANTVRDDVPATTVIPTPAVSTTEPVDTVSVF